METTRMQPQTTAALFAVGGIFGSSFLLVKVLVADMPPAQITAWRLLFGAVAVTAILAVRGRLRMPTESALRTATVLALLDSVIPNTLLAWAQIRIDSSVAAVLISSMPIFTVLFAQMLPQREHLSPAKALGLVLGFVGVALLVGADARSAGSGPPAAHLAVILAAMSNAAAVVYARSLLSHEDPLELSGLKLFAGAAIAMAVAAALHRGQVAPHMDTSRWVMLISLGVMGNAVARTLYLWLIASAGSVRASLVAYIVPAVGVVLGWLVLHEQFGTGAAVGMATIGVGMMLVTRAPQIAPSHRPDTDRLPAAAIRAARQ